MLRQGVGGKANLLGTWSIQRSKLAVLGNGSATRNRSGSRRESGKRKGQGFNPDAAKKHRMKTWHKRDWQQFYEIARRPWKRHRPPRPVYPTGLNRVLPAQGFSLSELDDAGVDLDQAERLGLPVDAGRIGAYGPNVTVLRDFVRSSRQPL